MVKLMDFSSKVESIWYSALYQIDFILLQCAPTGDDQNDCAICRTHWEAEPRVQTIHGTHDTRYTQCKVQMIQGTYKPWYSTHDTWYTQCKVQTMQGTCYVGPYDYESDLKLKPLGIAGNIYTK